MVPWFPRSGKSTVSMERKYRKIVHSFSHPDLFVISYMQFDICRLNSVCVMMNTNSEQQLLRRNAVLYEYPEAEHPNDWNTIFFDL